MGKFDKNIINLLLESAIQAPSADNCHRVRFQLIDDTVLIRYTGTEFIAHTGYKKVLALLSLGALSENFAIAASHFGIVVNAVLSSDLMRDQPVIKLHLHANFAQADPLWQMVSLRHTNRGVIYRGPKLSTDERNGIESAVNSYPTTKLVWLTESTQRRRVLRLMYLAETERFHNRLLHEELFSAIRFDVGWDSSCKEGLPPGALGVESLQRTTFAQLRHWSVMRVANLFGAHYMLGFRACYLPCRLAPDLGLLAVNNVSNQSVFDAGRSFQRLWLTLTQQGRVLQPMPASALYALEGVQNENIPIKLHCKLANGWKDIFGKEIIPIMLFRTGYAKPMPVTAGRQAVDYYFESN